MDPCKSNVLKKTQCKSRNHSRKSSKENSFLEDIGGLLASENVPIHCGVGESVKTNRRSKGSYQINYAEFKERTRRDGNRRSSSSKRPNEGKRKKKVVNTESRKKIKVVHTTPVHEVEETPSPVSPSIPDYIMEYVKEELRKYEVMKWVDALIEKRLGVQFSSSLLEPNPFNMIPRKIFRLPIRPFYVPISSIGQGESNIFSDVAAYEECASSQSNDKWISERSQDRENSIDSGFGSRS